MPMITPEILLVEDCNDDAAITLRLFQMAGIKNFVSRARDGAGAIAYLDEAEAGHRSAPAILLLDLKLPDMSGFDILNRIHRRPAFAGTLRIILSQLGDLESVKKAYTLGAHSFLNKPATRTELDELIKVFPTHWSLATLDGLPDDSHHFRFDLSSPAETYQQNRKTFQRIRADLQNLRSQIENKEEALAIIDNIMAELHEQRLARSQGEPSARQS